MKLAYEKTKTICQHKFGKRIESQLGLDNSDLSSLVLETIWKAEKSYKKKKKANITTYTNRCIENMFKTLGIRTAAFKNNMVTYVSKIDDGLVDDLDPERLMILQEEVQETRAWFTGKIIDKLIGAGWNNRSIQLWIKENI